ncbi:unnamed protein product, partial [Ectocarpus fasciculatus]
SRGSGCLAQEESIRCICGGAGRDTGDGGEGGVMMLDCDRCHRWFHGHCVGITSQEVRRRKSVVLPSFV